MAEKTTPKDPITPEEQAQANAYSDLHLQHYNFRPTHPENLTVKEKAAAYRKLREKIRGNALETAGIHCRL